MNSLKSKKYRDQIKNNTSISKLALINRINELESKKEQYEGFENFGCLKCGKQADQANQQEKNSILKVIDLNQELNNLKLDEENKM